MPDEIINLSRFYSDQYGMIFHNIYSPIDFTLKGYIIFKSIKKNYLIMCSGLTEKEIAEHFHMIIYEILAERGTRPWQNAS